MTETRRTKGVQQGPRSERVIRAVQQATIEELTRSGFAGLTMNGVAKAAGVSRSTLYRRWPTKEALIESLFEDGLQRLHDPADTGSLLGDLEILALRLGENMHDPLGRALAQVLARPDLRSLADEAGRQARAPFARAFERALERGELRDVDVEAAVHLLFFGVVHWVLERDGAVDAEGIGRLVAQIV